MSGWYRRLPQLQAPDLSLVIVGGKGWLYERLLDQVRALDVQDRVVFCRVRG